MLLSFQRQHVCAKMRQLVLAAASTIPTQLPLTAPCNLPTDEALAFHQVTNAVNIYAAADFGAGKHAVGCGSSWATARWYAPPSCQLDLGHCYHQRHRYGTLLRRAAAVLLTAPCWLLAHCAGVHKRLSLKGVAGFAVCPSERPLVAAYVSGRGCCPLLPCLCFFLHRPAARNLSLCSVPVWVLHLPAALPSWLPRLS